MLVLTVDPVIVGFDTVNICQGIDYTFIDTTIADGGDYQRLIQTAEGCDSLVNLHLIIDPIHHRYRVWLYLSGCTIHFHRR